MRIRLHARGRPWQVIRARGWNFPSAAIGCKEGAPAAAMELNPFAYDFHEDPYPTYHWLREHAPVYRNEALDFYALSRFADVFAAILDHETYSSAKGTVLEIDATMIENFPIILFMDPPRHTRLRKLVGHAFTPRRIAALEATARALAVHYLDRIVERGTCDFI